MEQTTCLSDEAVYEQRLRVKLIGVGGGGSNAIDRLKLDHLNQINLAVINTDGQALSASPVSEKLLLGRSVTRGLSAGGEMEVGRQAADADRELLSRMVQGVDLVFILTALGGGTGSGAAPVLAEIAAAHDALVVAFVTMPFSREGNRRQQQAQDALVALRKSCHAVISLPNDLLLQQIDEQATVMEAFAVADEWIKQGVHSIWSMLFQNGLINVDFAAFKRAFARKGGKTLFGTGFGSGPDCVNAALSDLQLCPLLHLPENKYLRRTDSLIVNLTGGPDLTMSTVNHVMDVVADKFGSRDNLILGAAIDGSMQHSLRITVIGTTDLATLPKAARTSVPAAGVPANVAPPLPVTPPPVAAPVGERFKDAARRRADQVEFGFAEDNEQRRGFFEKTDENLHEGEDLDVPTYLRRGIRIQIT
jgi:cell division protein FtsZ